MDHSYFIHKVLSDEALILRTKQGDWDAYAVFCERHRTVCTSQPTTCCMMTRMPEMPYKLFATVWQDIGRIEATGNVKGYLYTVLRNRVLTTMSPNRHLDEYIASYFAFGPRAASLTEETVLVGELEQLLEEKNQPAASQNAEGV